MTTATTVHLTASPDVTAHVAERALRNVLGLAHDLALLVDDLALEASDPEVAADRLPRLARATRALVTVTNEARVASDAARRARVAGGVVERTRAVDEAHAAWMRAEAAAR